MMTHSVKVDKLTDKVIQTMMRPFSKVSLDTVNFNYFDDASHNVRLGDTYLEVDGLRNHTPKVIPAPDTSIFDNTMVLNDNAHGEPLNTIIKFLQRNQ